MKDSLLNLQRGIGLREYSSETEEKRSRYHWHTSRRPRGYAVQYGGCVKQRASSSESRRRDQEQDGPIDRGKHRWGLKPRRAKSGPITHTNWGIMGRGETCSFFFYLWNNLFSSSLIFPKASCCWGSSSSKKDGKLVHAFSPSSPQSVFVWSNSCLCVTQKKRGKRDDDCLYSLDCSKRFVP